MINFTDLLRNPQSSAPSLSPQMPTPMGWDGQANGPYQMSIHDMPTRPSPIRGNPGLGHAAPQANFFDQFDAPTQAPQPQTPTQVQQAPTPQPQQQSAPEPLRHSLTPGGVQDVAASRVDPDLKNFTDQLNQLVNSGASREQIYAFLREHPNQTATGVEEALAYRDAHHAEVPVYVNHNQVTKLPDWGAGGSGVLGAVDTITLGAGDEIDAALGATGNSIGNLVGLGDGKTWQQTYDQREANNQAILAGADENHPFATNVGRLAGAVAVPIPAVGWAKDANTLANVAKLGAEGAGYGAAYGFNSGTSLDDRLNRAEDGAFSGLATGVVMSPVSATLARVGANRLENDGKGQAVLDAADSLNQRYGSDIKPLPGHVSRGGTLSLGQALLEPTLLGGTASGLRKASKNFGDEVANTTQQVAENAAQGPRRALEDVVAEARAPSTVGGLGSFKAEMEQRALGNYNVAAQLAGNARLRTPRTINRIDEILNDWRKVPGGVAGTKELENLREELANGFNGDGTHDLQGLRDLRTMALGDNIDSASRNLKRVAKQLWPVLSKDITHGLTEQGKGRAASLYQATDKQYAKDIESLGIVERLLGGDRNNSSVGTMKRIVDMANNDADKLQHVLGTIDQRIAHQIRGGIIDTLGKTNASRAVEDGQFSLESFTTRWESMGDTAKSALFSKSIIKDLNDLATLTRADRSVRQLGNPSRSGIILENWRQAGTVAKTATAVARGGLQLAALPTIAGLPLTGRLLASPKIARALVVLGRTGKETALRKAIKIGLQRANLRRDPALVQDFLGLQSSLDGAPQVTVDQAQPQAPTDQPTDSGANYFDQFDGQ